MRKDVVYMDVPLSPISPAKLYAFQLKLRPLQEGTLMPFSGELVHAAWLSWLGSAAPEVGSWLHEGNKRRLFTCSSLQFPFPASRMCEAERGNVHMPLTPEKTYTIRITLLLGELFPLFHSALMDFNTKGSSCRKPPFMQLGNNNSCSKRWFLILTTRLAGQASRRLINWLKRPGRSS